MEFAKRLLSLGDSAVVLDTETTGLDHSAEVLEIGVLSLAGDVLMDQLIQPWVVESWPEAQRVHGISPKMVADAPTLAAVLPTLRDVVAGKTVVVYNADYDRRLLYQSARVCCADKFEWLFLDEVDWRDVMDPYARFWGAPGPRGRARWQKLTAACQQQGVVVADSHRAIGDCRMTLALLQKLAGG